LKDFCNPCICWLFSGLALLVFGPKKLPELGKGIGDGIRGFKAALQEKEHEEPAKISTPENQGLKSNLGDPATGPWSRDVSSPALWAGVVQFERSLRAACLAIPVTRLVEFMELPSTSAETACVCREMLRRFMPVHSQ
jgi:sec-independent protein translocase protein TatA